jgi:1-deoxy-D-xylulose-5-phosphate synthase
MMEKMPHRTFDVGIAEQHAVTFSAGLAKQGMLPFCNIYSTFMQRAYDQIIHDVALQNLNVVFCLDRGGIVGADGPTHHGVFDLAYMRSIPNMTVAAPMDEVELRNMMYTAQLENMGPFSIRYPRGCGCIVNWQQPMEKIEPGKGRQLSEGDDMAILSIGTTGIYASRAVKMLAKDGFSVAHFDLRFVKPLDEEMLHTIFRKYQKVLTVEDGVILGGFGSAIIEFMIHNGYCSKVVTLGVPDRFIEQGKVEELHRECGYDQQGIYHSSLELLQK